MTDRLVDIGIRRQLVADIYELRPCDDWEKDQDRLLNDDIPWLIDRVRELEAQAALRDYPPFCQGCQRGVTGPAHNSAATTTAGASGAAGPKM